MGFPSPHFLTRLWAPVSLGKSTDSTMCSRPKGSAWAGGTWATGPQWPAAAWCQACGQACHFWHLAAAFQSCIRVWCYTLGERVKCTLLIFVAMEETEQESQRGLHLGYFNLFNVWLHHLKNKISKTPGEKAFWFEWEKQEEMPTPPLSRGDCPPGDCAARHLPAWGREGDTQGRPQPLQPLVSKLEFRGTVWNTQNICRERVPLLFQTTSCSFL